MKKTAIFLLSLSCVAAAGCQTSGLKSAFRSGQSTEDVASAELAELKAKGKNSAKPESELDEAIKQASAEISNETLTAPISQSDPSADIDSLLNKAKTAQQRQEMDSAKTLYKQVIAKHPNNGEAHHGLAVIADLQQNFTLAKHHYEMAMKATPLSPDLLNDVGYSYFLQKDYAKSEFYFQQVLDIAPSHASALMNYGRLLAMQGNTERALTLFRRAKPDVDARTILAQATGIPATNSAPPFPGPADNAVVNALATGPLPTVNPFPTNTQTPVLQPGYPQTATAQAQPIPSGNLMQPANPVGNTGMSPNPFDRNRLNNQSMAATTAPNTTTQPANPFALQNNMAANSNATAPPSAQQANFAQNNNHLTPYNQPSTTTNMPAAGTLTTGSSQVTNAAGQGFNTSQYNPFANAMGTNNPQPATTNNTVPNPFARGGQNTSQPVAPQHTPTLNTGAFGTSPQASMNASASVQPNSGAASVNTGAFAANHNAFPTNNNGMSTQPNNSPWGNSNSLPAQQMTTPTQPVQQPYSTPVNNQPLFGQPTSAPLFNSPQSSNQQPQGNNQLFSQPAQINQPQTIQQSSFASADSASSISNANYSTPYPNNQQVVPAGGLGTQPQFNTNSFGQSSGTTAPNSPW